MFQVRLFKNEGGASNQLAGGYLTVANAVKINIRLLKTKTGGYFVSFPSYKKQNSEEWVSYVDPVSKEARAAITTAVVEEYMKITGQSVEHRGDESRVEKPYNNEVGNKVVQAIAGNGVPSGVPF